MLVALLVGGLVALAALVFWLERRVRPVEEMYHHTRCPGCRQKLRFQSRQAGRPAACPRCKKMCTLPAALSSAAE